MKVGVIYYGNIDALNGASKVVKSFSESCEIFENNGIEISNIYALHSNDLIGNNENVQNVKLKARIKKILANTTIGSIASVYLQYFRNAGKVIKKYDEDSQKSEEVLIFHDIFSCYVYHKKQKTNAKKTIMVLHNDGNTWKMLYTQLPKLNKGLIRSFFNQVESLVCEKSNKIVFVSKTSMENFLINNEKHRKKTTYIYNGIPKLGEYQTKSFEQLNMITVGTLCQRKAQDLILKSLVEIEDKSAKLSLIGSGPTYEELYSYSEENNLLGQVNFLGSRNDVDMILRKHNVFILTSRDEGLPISIIEAMRTGLPIIATDVGGNKELIDGNGLLIEPNVKSIVQAIDKINKDRTVLSDMSKKSFEIFIDNFELSKMISNYSKLCKEVYNEK